MVTLGEPGVARCQEMATLPVGYIPQHKVPAASSSGSLGFIVCVMKCCTMVDSVPIRHIIAILQPIQSDHLMMMPAQELGTPVAQVFGLNPQLGDYIVSPMLQTKKQTTIIKIFLHKLLQVKVSVAVVLPYSMFKMREYKQIIMKSAMTLEGSAFEEMFDLSPYLEMVQPIPAPIEVLGKICDQVSSLCTTSLI